MQVQLVHPPVTAGGAAAASSSSDGGAPPSDGSSGSSGSAGEGSSRGAAGSKGGRRVITVVGNLPQVAVGQALRLRGTWVEHKQYGRQLKATDLEEVALSSDDELVTYLGGGAIAGVGPVTARCMVERWGVEIESKLNSRAAVRHLTACSGIGPAKAEKIKAAWDATKGTRDGVRFLQEHAIPLPLAQRIAERHGHHTVAQVAADPYAALAGFGMPFSKLDLLACRMGARPDLVSRAAAAVLQCLGEAATEEGHCYLPWSRLEHDVAKLLQETGRHHGSPWGHAGSLDLVAQLMHTTGGLVAEPGGGSAAQQAAQQDPDGSRAGAAPDPGAWLQADGEPPQQGGAAAAAPGRQHPDFAGDLTALRDHLAGKLKGVPAAAIDGLLSAYGSGALAVLDSPHREAVKQLCKCRKVGPKTAEKVKLAWEAAHGNAPAAGGSGPPLGGPPGVTMQELLESPPAVDFPWQDNTRCYPKHLHAAEEAVAQRSLQRASGYRQADAIDLAKVRKWVKHNQANQAAAGAGIQLNEGQVRAIELASGAPLMVLTGGPGCGKTTVVQTIVKLWCAQGKMVRIAAPTGRAAQRMGEIQGIEPCTIHRLLGYQPRKGGGGGDAGLDAASEEARLGTQGVFQYNRDNPLPAKAVLVDEASMLSLPLAVALIDALRPDCQLVLVGDIDQLPPVGPGAVLHNLIASKLVPVVDLREIFRQAAASNIITSALAVRRGDVPLLQPVAPTADAFAAATSDALLVATAAPDDFVAAVQQAVTAMAGAQGGAPDDLQVLSPMRKGTAGTSVLNPMLQALLNPPAPGKPELPRHAGGGGGAGAGAFRVGDRVLQLVNNYDKEVFNGDHGRVTACYPSERRLVVHYPHLDKGGADGGVREYQGVELAQLELAYAITVHKAQGGEAAHVVLALSPVHGRMLTRRLLYTGLTRAKRQLVVVSTGTTSSGATPLQKAVRKKDSEIRLTSLQGRLEEGRVAGGLPQLESQLFSNEEQMLAAAVQAQAQAAEARAAAAGVGGDAAGAGPADGLGVAGAAPRGLLPSGEGGVATTSSSSGGGSGCNVTEAPPSDEAAAAERRVRVAALAAAFDIPDEEAARLVELPPWPGVDPFHAVRALAWLQANVDERLTVFEVVQRAPALLAMDPVRLASLRQFVEKRGMGQRSSPPPDGAPRAAGAAGASSAVEGWLALTAGQPAAAPPAGDPGVAEGGEQQAAAFS
ncbi:exodeoxyribonuclease V subunit alpha [Micractinium conductrix]|uniref:Exodeoxyribonuclease V subunit alpha n=1 Tax=Micractinium conductrix TaxID=554055 RepID=A0A2P6VB02_9CHLO|nr:exodeoxyribonuclease V subunit alpha [Micractinium conductrix]|eukprot:PSC71270.1 exodeoxyribonuclease V subunit alpha [Micractinium conductrix]